MWKADGLFTDIRFCWSHEWLSLRFDFDEAATERHGGMRIEVTLQGPTHTFRLAFALNHPGPDHFVLSQATGQDAWLEIGPYQSICRARVLELALPWKDLHLAPEQEVRMSIIILEHGLEVARYPHQRPARLTVPGPEFDATMWRV
jgi:hypothetical protein